MRILIIVLLLTGCVHSRMLKAIVLIIVGLVPGLVRAEFLPFIGAFVSETNGHEGIDIGVSIGDEIIFRPSLIFSDNLRGLNVAVGREFYGFSVFLAWGYILALNLLTTPV